MQHTDRTIDLNADLGEGFGRWALTDDEGLLGVVSSANVACGFHAGDPSTMRRVCELAAAGAVRVGAQVSYRDLAGFGRRPMELPAAELADEVAYQIGALRVFAEAAGTPVAYVKPHGALYNRVVWDEEQAGAVVAGILLAGGGLPVLGLPGSAVHRAAAAAGLPVVAEAFPDRAYRADGTLVPRSEPGAVIHDPDTVVARALALAAVADEALSAPAAAIPAPADQDPDRVPARSLCIHGDTAGAVDLARRVRQALTGAGIRIGPFA
ncbi:MAG TPA: 5-oxoprolinase subunit PxpA [Actinocrinis sp.]|nr:5-oxoprolinase subunit PxpA [Actinocrinis sp.]